MLASSDSDTGRISLYIRIARVMRERILRGDWPVGKAIPTIDELCEHFAASRNTIRQSLQLLTDAGLINGSRGRPTMVIAARPRHQDDPKLLHAAINDPFSGSLIDIKVLERKTIKAPPPDLTKGYPLFESYLRIRKVHNLNKRPYVLAEFYVAAAAAKEFLPGSERKSKIDWLLNEQKALPICRKKQLISTSHADEDVAMVLACEMGETIVNIRRWWEDASGRLICASLSDYRADTFVFEVIDEGQH